MSNRAPLQYLHVAATIKFDCTQEKDDMKDAYAVMLTKLSPAAVEAIEAWGVKVLDGVEQAKSLSDEDAAGWKREQGRYFTPKSNKPMEVVLPGTGEALGRKMGNGTEVEATLYRNEGTLKSGKTYVVARVGKLIVTKMVEEAVPGSRSVDDEDDRDVL